MDPDSGRRVPFGQQCTPPKLAEEYLRDFTLPNGFEVRNRVMVGAFATNLKLSPDGTRLFAPVRGTASLTWADVTPDDPSWIPGDHPEVFHIECGAIDKKTPRCDRGHRSGDLPAIEPENTRQVSLPGEPFGLAFTPDGSAAVVTHQSTPQVSLFMTGLGSGGRRNPSLQFVLDGVPTGGIGVASVPHASCPFPDCPPEVRPSFLLTSRSVNQVSLLRYYTDTGVENTMSSQLRPFLVQEGLFSLSAAAGGADSRGIVVDPTPRIKCVAEVPPKGGTRMQEDVDADIATCLRLPARVFIANRTPPSLIVGDMGGLRPDGAYDPDRLSLYANVPLVTGPSNVYLAPIVDKDGRFVLRLFVVCYDQAVVLVIDPDTRQLEAVIRTGPGPFAMAFDPFDIEAAARHDLVPMGARNDNIKAYRFAYVASFLHSYVQAIDLDGSLPSKETFETIVFNLGQPTPPKGS